MNKFVEELFKWLKDILPSFLAGLGIGYNQKEKVLAKQIVENKKLKQELIENENKKIVDKKYSGLSDADAIRAIINSPDDDGNTTH